MMIPIQAEAKAALRQVISPSLLARPTGRRRLPASAALLLWLLNDLGGKGSFPGATAIARALSMDRRTITRAQSLLVRAGLLRLDQSPHRGREYRLLFPRGTSGPWVDLLKVAASVPVLPDRLPRIEVMRDDSSQGDVASRTRPHEVAPEDPIRLTEVDAAWICASSAHTSQFLQYGVRGIRLEPSDCQTLTSAPTNWEIFGPADPSFPYDRRWRLSQFVGFFWTRTCDWRERHGVPLQLPDLPLLLTILKEQLESLGGWSLYARLHLLTEHFDLIRHIGGNAGYGLLLDESALTNPVVDAAITEIDSHGRKWFDGKLEEIVRSAR